MSLTNRSPVPHPTLGEVGTFTRGAGLQKSELLEAGVPAIHYGQVHTHYGVWATETKSFVDASASARYKRAQPGALVIATTSEDDAAVAKATAWLGNEAAAVSGDAHIFHHSLDPKFVAYFFQTADFQRQKQAHLTGAKVRRISAYGLSRIRIPLPPLEIQRDIVEALDGFRALEAELEAELEARRRQYSYHLSRQIVGPTGSEWQREAVAALARLSYGLTASATDSGAFRLLRITDINANGKLKPDAPKFVEDTADARRHLVRSGDLLMARTGATYGKTMLVRGVPNSVFASFLIRIEVDRERLLPSFYWHFAQSRAYWSQAEALVSTAGQPQFNGNALARVKVPLPPLRDQERIVEVLDSFDALVNDLSIGLPAELTARRKQYEHYRDKLLTFPEAS